MAAAAGALWGSDGKGGWIGRAGVGGVMCGIIKLRFYIGKDGK